MVADMCGEAAVVLREQVSIFVCLPAHGCEWSIRDRERQNVRSRATNDAFDSISGVLNDVVSSKHSTNCCSANGMGYTISRSLASENSRNIHQMAITRADRVLNRGQ